MFVTLPMAITQPKHYQDKPGKPPPKDKEQKEDQRIILYTVLKTSETPKRLPSYQSFYMQHFNALVLNLHRLS
jgi:hypothetical protein